MMTSACFILPLFSVRIQSLTLCRLVALALLPKTACNALRMADLPEPFWPTMKLTRSPNDIVSWPWHMKLVNLIWFRISSPSQPSQRKVLTCFNKLFVVRNVFESGSPSLENSFEVLFLGFESLPITGFYCKKSFFFTSQNWILAQSDTHSSDD